MSALARKRAWQAVCVSMCVLGLLWLRLADPGLISAMRGSGFDALQRLYPRQMAEAAPVRIVDIDEASLQKLGQWPWSRFKMAELVNKLGEMGAAVIAFDIVFPEHDRLSPRRILQDESLKDFTISNSQVASLPDSDQALAAAMSGKPVVAAFAASRTGVESQKLMIKSGFAQLGAPALEAAALFKKAITNIPEIDAAASGLGGINIDLAGEQGVARQIPLLWSTGERFAPALSLEALRVGQGVDTLLVTAASDTENAIESIRVGDFDVPVAETGMFYVHYRPDPKDLYISAADILSLAPAEGLREKLEGHIVLIGTSAVGLLDVRTTALGETVPGVSVHAQAIEQILTGRFLYRPIWVEMLELLFVGLAGLVLAVAGAVYRPLATFLVAATAGLAYVAGVLYAFKVPGLLFDVTFPLVALVLTYLASTAFRLVITDRDGRSMRRMFGHYVAPAVLEDIERNPQNLKLGGETRDVTVMFVDIANFTPLSERLSPDELVQTVNGLWDACSKAILERQGTIDKFIGDAIMAFWNAPVPVANHQAQAARAALGLRAVVERYNKTEAVTSLLRARDVPPIAVRVGLASGPACVGNMGSSERFDYSVLGETVNTAARTESSCKRAGHDILIAGELQPDTRSLAVLSAGHMGMKGKSKPEPIHALIGDEAEKARESFAELQREHDYLATKLAKKPSRRGTASLRPLLQELALRNPLCAGYLNTMLDRAEDYAHVSQTRDRG